MMAAWSIAALLKALSARGDHPAIVLSKEAGIEIWPAKAVAEKTLGLARGLRGRGIGKGDRVVLWAPNSPVWIVAALAVLAAGAVLVPVDDLAEPENFEAALASSRARLIVTTARRLAAYDDSFRARRSEAVAIDPREAAGGAIPSWQSLVSEAAGDLPVAGDDDPAVLSWTSGTTGSPKAFFLTHRNIATNVAALRDLAIVGPRDRALLPLPLHHAYPFVVGMLTPLTVGTAVILPAGTTGPLLMQALRDGEATAIVGVPRLYEALWAAIEGRVGTRARPAGLAWRALLRLAIAVRQTTGWRLGRVLFAPVRHAIAPRLRLLVSGGARLDRRIEERLDALGWTVLSGYGLAESASLFTGNRPGAHRWGSAGRPLADGAVRIARADDQGVGEIELRGRSITAGYIDNPDADRAAFTPDGWFRTGDIGFIDREGFLFVTGRTKEVLVLGGGKKVIPEDLERIYGAATGILELAVLENEGALVALVRPDTSRLQAQGVANLRDGVRVALGETAQSLPSYQRLSGFALTEQPLPRTRLGKYRRFLLPALYAEAASGTARRAPHALAPEDAELLRDPIAAAIWSLLRERYPDQAIDLDVNLALDLSLDSFGWMELAILFEDRVGVHLSDTDIAGIRTIRDLLRIAVGRRGAARAAPPASAAIAMQFERWLAPTGRLLTALGFALYSFNRMAMAGLFRLRVAGADRLPATGPFVIAPNHASYLDGPAIAAALSWPRARQLFWAGDILRLFSNPLSRLFCRAAHVFPVDAAHPDAALEAASRVLSAGNVLVWFPEGWRSPDGRLQRFQPGIGQLLRHSGAPAVPALITGAFEALPRHRRMPRLCPITVCFGQPEPVERLQADGSGHNGDERVANALRERLAILASDSEAAAKD